MPHCHWPVLSLWLARLGSSTHSWRWEWNCSYLTYQEGKEIVPKGKLECSYQKGVNNHAEWLANHAIHRDPEGAACLRQHSSFFLTKTWPSFAMSPSPELSLQPLECWLESWHSSQSPLLQPYQQWPSRWGSLTQQPHSYRNQRRNRSGKKLLACIKFRFILLGLIVIFIWSQVIHSYRSYYSGEN